MSKDPIGNTSHQESWQSFSGGLPHIQIPAYPIGTAEMRPVTKITVFGFRLGLVALACYWIAIFVGTHLPASVIMVGAATNDKVKHFTAYFLLGLLLCYVTNSQKWTYRFLAIGVAGMAYAAIDEFTQQFVPGRFADVNDFIADALGLWLAISLYVLAKWVYLMRTGNLTIDPTQASR